IDAVDTPFTYQGRNYHLIDTAGLRRKSRREEDLEIISAFKAEGSIHRANLVLVVIDAILGPTDQDARILQSILEAHKAVLVVANKVDAEPFDRGRFVSQLQNEFHFFEDVPFTFVSAKSGKGLRELMSQIQSIEEKMFRRISTSELNDFFFDVIRKAPAPVYGTTNVKFYYMTQTRQVPPAFIAFANHPDGVDRSYRRFLLKNLKERFDLRGIPIRIFVMKSRGGR
ncbi:MAG: ribosome biogenesis GTPase Der, partial [Bdellovibrio sp.]